MDAKVVTIKELTEDNPTLCLSALRVFNKCPECQVYKLAQAHNRLYKLKCKPHVNPKYEELLAQKRNLLDMLQHIEDEMKNL